MIKLFENFNQYNQVIKWLVEMNINKYTINGDLSVDVNQSVLLGSIKLIEIPIQFGIVNGDFFIDNNELVSFKGFPKKVTGYLDCSHNKITNMVGSPTSIGGFFNCYDNNITSLKGGPIEIEGGLNIYNNPLPEIILNFEDKKAIFINQDEYGIWNSDDTFNKERFEIFKDDYSNDVI